MVALAGMFIANRTMFRMGIRNLPRRRTQSILVVTGLMLATFIISASFVTRDAIDYSETSASYDVLQRTDISLHHFRPVSGDAPFDHTYAPESVTGQFEERFAKSPDIEGFMPFLYVHVKRGPGSPAEVARRCEAGLGRRRTNDSRHHGVRLARCRNVSDDRNNHHGARRRYEPPCWPPCQ